jgi:hypothetical protein
MVNFNTLADTKKIRNIFKKIRGHNTDSWTNNNKKVISISGKNKPLRTLCFRGGIDTEEEMIKLTVELKSQGYLNEVKHSVGGYIRVMDCLFNK